MTPSCILDIYHCLCALVMLITFHFFVIANVRSEIPYKYFLGLFSHPVYCNIPFHIYKIELRLQTNKICSEYQDFTKYVMEQLWRPTDRLVKTLLHNCFLSFVTFVSFEINGLNSQENREKVLYIGV